MKHTIFFGAAVIAVLVLVKFTNSQSVQSTAAAAQPANNTTGKAVATFAGGCFWCIESTFEKLEGVTEAISGYSGGKTDNPTYREVGGGSTGHTETVQIYYDPDIISYEGLLHYFWRDIDPTDSEGQFVDRGSEYRPAIFYHNEEEKALALKTRQALEDSNRFSSPITVEIIPFEKFWEAEDYHQDYHKKNSLRYKLYRSGSGRDQFLQKVWGDDLDTKFRQPVKSSDGAATDSATDDRYTKPDTETIKSMLTPLQFEVTQHEATEPPFNNLYWNNKADGIYVDIVTGEPLFSSTTKFRSGTGWPSFWEPIDESFIVKKTDYKLLYPRTEIKSKYGQSHLGHVFNDGPAPTGLRYCINSAALRFVEKDNMADEGYERYMALFE